MLKKIKYLIDNYYCWIVGLLLITAVFFRFYGLKHPDWKVFDEIYYTDFAVKHLLGGTYFDVHPPLGKILIAFGIKLFGFNPLGWRIMEAVFGSLLVGLIFLIAYKIFKNKYIALISLLLANCCTFLLVESRLALINIFLTAFITASIYLFFVWLENKKPFYAYGSIIMWALGLSVKWTAVYIIPVFILYVLIFPEPRAALSDFISKWYRLILIIILPVLFYLGIFLLGNISGFDLIEWHRQAFGFHHHLTQTHPYASKWYTWLFMIRPICLEYKTVNNQLIGILEIGNIAIFWTGIAALIFGIFIFFQKDENRDKLFFLIAGILLYLLPWIFISRVSFLYLFLPAAPMLIILVSYFLYQLCRYRLQIIAILIIIASIAWFAFFLPIVIGIPTTQQHYHERMWLRSWI